MTAALEKAAREFWRLTALHRDPAWEDVPHLNQERMKDHVRSILNAYLSASAPDSAGLVRNLQSVAEASKREDGSHIPLGDLVLRAADTIAALSAQVEQLRADAAQWRERAEKAEGVLLFDVTPSPSMEATAIEWASKLRCDAVGLLEAAQAMANAGLKDATPAKDIPRG